MLRFKAYNAKNLVNFALCSRFALLIVCNFMSKK